MIEATRHVGWACRVSAATPATCGDAIEVPESVAAPLPVPTPVDTIDTPGALSCGLRKLSPKRGPLDENDATASKAGLGTVVLDAVARPPSASLSLAPSEVVPVGRPRTPKNGIVTTKRSPVSGFEVIGPSIGG